MNVKKRQTRFFAKGDKGLKAFFIKFLHKFFRIASKKLNLFATYDILDLSHQSNVVALVESDARIGIVIQGPIIPGTTLEICKFYKQIYPNVQIVLSTWGSENTDQFQTLNGGRFTIIQTEKPEVSGPSNINMQIVSTIAGLNHLIDKDCTHILKTRTDILLGNSSFLNYLMFMHSKGKQNALVFSSFNSFLFRLFSPSDQVMFGEVADIKRFWSIGLIPDNQEIEFPEKYLFKKYLESWGYKAQEDLTNYLTALRDYTVIADHELLGQIWNKGAYTALNYRWRGANFPNHMTQLCSWHWEILHHNLDYFTELNNSLS
jgi:hypothetical protein